MASSPLNPDPRVAALIAAGRGDSSGIAPPAPDSMTANPAALPQAGQSDIANILQQLFSMPEQAQPRAAMDTQRQEIDNLSQQKTDMPKPKQGWLDTQGAAPKAGILHSILRALTAVGAATGPGQAIQGAVYNPEINRYNRSQQNIADRIAAIKDEFDISKTQLSSAANTTGAATNMYYKGNMVQQGQEKVDVSKQKLEAYNQWHGQLANIMQGNLDLKTKALAVHQQLGLMGVQVQHERNNVILSLGGNRMTLDANKFNADVANGNQTLIDQIEQGLGLKKFFGVDSPIGNTAVQPMAPGGGNQPFPAPAKSAPSTPKSPVQSKPHVLTEQPDGTFK